MIAFTLVVLLAAPRSSFQEPKPVEKATEMKAHRTARNPGVTLETTATVKNGRLEIEYEVQNSGKGSIYLFNKLYTDIDSKGVWHVDPDRVYTIFSKGQGSLAKRVIQIPENLAVNVPEVPLITKLDAGKSFRETVSLSLPLKTWDPYSRPAPGDPTTLESLFTWEVGYFRGDSGTSKLETVVPTTKGTAICFTWPDASEQSILKTEPFPFRVPFKIVEIPRGEGGRRRKRGTQEEK